MQIAKVTKELIFEAADRLQSEGKNATLAAVRQLVGGGSFTTISEGMREWKIARQASVFTSPVREPAPDSVSEKLGILASDIWSAALEKANEKLQSEREAMVGARSELENAKAEAVELADQMESELLESRKENEQLILETEKQLVENNKIKSEIISKTEALSISEVLVKTTSAALTEAHLSVERSAFNLNSERQARSEAENLAQSKGAEAAALEGRLVSEKERTLDLTERLGKIESKLDDSISLNLARHALILKGEAEISRLQAEYESAKVAANLVIKTCDEAKEIAAERLILISTARAEIDHLNKNLDATTTRAVEAEDRARQAGEATAELRGRVSAMEENARQASPFVKTTEGM